MKPVILNVDLNRKCKKCGSDGVVNETGQCMKCIGDQIAKKGINRMVSKEPTERLPGMPGPAAAAVERREEIEDALERLHDVLLPMLEGLPSGDEAQGSISIRLKIQGDTVTVTLKPGSGE